MFSRLMTRPWIRHLSVAAGYGAGFALFHAMSFSHWSIFAGFQLAALLLTPYRYWPALALGESVSVGYVAVDCANQFGLTWAIFKMVPSIVLVMPIVFLCREHLHLFDRKTRAVNMTVLILCASAAALVVSAYNTGLLSLAPRPPSYAPLSEWALRYGLGHYLGILTIAPLALCICEATAGTSLQQIKTRLAASRFLIDSAGILLPSLGLLVWIGLTAPADSDVRYLAQVAMFLPMVVLALKHGWHGAAVGGMAASIAIVLLMPARYDHGTMQAQTFMAFAISTMLLMGTRVTALNRREKQDQWDTRMALALAQRNYFEGERQLRQAASALLDLQRTGYLLLNRLMQWSPFEARLHDDLMRQRVKQAERHIEHLHPLQGVERNLSHTLQAGYLAQTLAEYDIALRADYYGNVSGLPHGIHLAIYRLICDSATFLLTQRPMTDIAIRVRSRERKGQRWVMLHIHGLASSRPMADESLQELRSRLHMISRPGGFQSIQDGAATFGGRSRQRIAGEFGHILVLLKVPV